MSIELQVTAMSVCELCSSTENLSIYEVPPAGYPDNKVTVCNTCLSQIQGHAPMDGFHWRFLSDKMWSEKPAIQVLSWRMLNQLRSEAWALENLEMMYLDEETQKWAEAADDSEKGLAKLVHKDANGNVLSDGDSVVITKSLDVKGSSVNLKMGTAIRNIRVVHDHEDQIEGKVNGQTIVVLTKYVRKQS